MVRRRGPQGVAPGAVPPEEIPEHLKARIEAELARFDN